MFFLYRKNSQGMRNQVRDSLCRWVDVMVSVWGMGLGGSPLLAKDFKGALMRLKEKVELNPKQSPGIFSNMVLAKHKCEPINYFHFLVFSISESAKDFNFNVLCCE